MKWGIETFVRIIFKTALLFVFFYAGFLVTEKIKEIKVNREYEMEQSARYRHMRDSLSPITRSIHTPYVKSFSEIRKDSIRDDSLMKRYR
jgi:hypothetical protein